MATVNNPNPARSSSAYHGHCHVIDWPLTMTSQQLHSSLSLCNIVAHSICIRAGIREGEGRSTTARSRGNNYVIAQISSVGFGSSCNGIVQLLLEFGYSTLTRVNWCNRTATSCVKGSTQEISVCLGKGKVIILTALRLSITTTVSRWMTDLGKEESNLPLTSTPLRMIGDISAMKEDKPKKRTLKKNVDTDDPRFDMSARTYRRDCARFWIVTWRPRLLGLSQPCRAVGSRGRHKLSHKPVTAHGSGLVFTKPEAGA